jgi:ribosomal protein L44E
MTSQFEERNQRPTLLALSFTCADCGRRFTRLIRGEPTLVHRCFACDAEHVQRSSERLLALAFGASTP